MNVGDIPKKMRQLTAELLVLVEQVDEPSGLQTEAAVAVRCGEVLNEVREMQKMVGDRRAQAVRYLLSQGLSFAQVGAAIGVSRQRAEQLSSK